jgi:hypothetical protein
MNTAADIPSSLASVFDELLRLVDRFGSQRSLHGFLEASRVAVNHKDRPPTKRETEAQFSADQLRQMIEVKLRFLVAQATPWAENAPGSDAVPPIPQGDLVADDGTTEAIEAWSRDQVIDIQQTAIMFERRRATKRRTLPPEVKVALDEAIKDRSTVAALEDGTAIFINYGDQPEDTASLSCTACGGSGHIDDQRDITSYRTEQIDRNALSTPALDDEIQRVFRETTGEGEGDRFLQIGRRLVAIGRRDVVERISGREGVSRPDQIEPLDPIRLDALEDLALGATPGPWRTALTLHDHHIGGTPHEERRIFTEWDHPQLRGPLGVVNMSRGIPLVKGDSMIQFVSISEADAAYIAEANPITMLSLIRLTRSALDFKTRTQPASPANIEGGASFAIRAACSLSETELRNIDFIRGYIESSNETLAEVHAENERLRSEIAELKAARTT